jgi:hypothetical protein
MIERVELWGSVLAQHSKAHCNNYVYANLMHDIMTRKSVTGILHLINKTPLDWYSKKEATTQ